MRGRLSKAAADLGEEAIAPGATRRNITVTLDELPRTHGTEIRLGEVLVEVWRDCAPCEYMEETVGQGARNALKGRSGISAKITKGGMIRIGDSVVVSPN